MSTSTLPSDPKKQGNVWCEACQQSLSAARAASHLVSKKHEDRVAGGASKTRSAPRKHAPSTRRESPTKGESSSSGSEDSESSDEEEVTRSSSSRKKAPASTPAAKSTKSSSSGAHGLPRDPHKEGNFWCGICEVSLSGKLAEEHHSTARHQANEKKTLTAAMGKMKLKSDK